MLVPKYIKSSFAIVGITILASCATIDYGTPIDSSMVTIERQRSRAADIGRIQVYQQKDGILVRGEVRGGSYSRSNMPGHVDIELLDANGEVLTKDTVRYRKTGLRSYTADFAAKLDKNIPKGGILRLTHHESASHK